MTGGMLVFLLIILLIVIFSLLKAERLVKLAFGSYAVLGFALAFGSLVLNGAQMLNQASETVFL